MRRASRLLLLAWCVTWLAPPAPVSAQPTGEPAPAAAEEPTAPDAPAAIPLPQVASRSESLQLSLQDVLARLAPEPAVTQVAEALPAMGEELEQEREATLAALEESSDLGALADLEEAWARQKRELETWRTSLTKRAVELEEQLETLDRAQQVWQLTLDAARASSAPEDVRRAIAANLDEIANVRRRVVERRGEILSLQGRVSRLELDATETLASLQAARLRIRSRLFEPDSLPLWQALFRPGTMQAVPRSMRVGVSTARRELVEFLVAHRRSFPAVGVLFVFALVGARFLRDRLRRSRPEGLTGSVRIFDLPVSIAVLALLLIWQLLFPLAPRAVDRIGLLVALLPALRIASCLLHEGFRPLLYAVTGFFVLDQARDLLASATLVERSVLFVETSAAFGLFALLLRPGRLAGIPREAAPPAWLALALRAGAFLLALASLANLFGYAGFARLVGEGVFGSVYLAVITYAVYRVGLTVAVVAVGSGPARQLGFVRRLGDVLLRWVGIVLRGVAAIAWVGGALRAFNVEGPTLALARTLLTTSLEFGTISVSLGDGVALAFTIAVAVVLSRVLRVVLEDDVYPRLRLRRGVGNAISTTAHYVILSIGFVLALGAAGVDFSRFTILAGALGVGVGFGLQNVVNNFVSGLILLFERPVQVGDTVEVGTLLGTVERIGVRSSTVRTFQGAEVIVPNANLVSEQVINWTHSDRERRLDLAVGVAYGSDHERVLELLRECADAVPGVMRDPEPVALFKGFGDSALDFELRAWTASERFPQVASQLMGAIYGALAREGITIPFPQRDLHLKSIQPEVRDALSTPRDA